MLSQSEAKARLGVFPVAPLQLQFTAAAGVAILGLLIFGGLGTDQRLSLVIGGAVIAVSSIVAYAAADGRGLSPALLVVPAMDVLGIVVMTREVAAAGLETLLVFPLIWLATAYPARIVSAGFAVMVAAIWVPRIPGIAGGEVGLGAVMMGLSATCAMALVSTVIWWIRRRSDAQHALLQRQAGMLENAFERTSKGEETLRQVLDAVGFAVLSFDGAGHLVTANRASRELVAGLNLPQTSELSTFPFYHGDGYSPVTPVENPVRRALGGENVEDEQYWLGHPGEARAALRVSTRVLRDRAGTATQVVLVASDITAEYEALQARDDLFASVSHELRTPLSSIIGYVDLALDTPELSEEVQEQLEVVSKNADRMLLLVNDLLANREREASGTLTVTKVPMDLVPVVLDSVAAIMPMAHDRLITVNVDLPTRLPLVGDALRLRQVVDNLLSNAIKYNREGGEVEVVGSTRHDAVQGDLIELAVSDTGRGMTAEETRRLFERFYRAPSVRHTAIRGSGLGLNISRELIDLHLGTIRVESVPDTGTTMTITLPSLEAA
ncbi:cell wall metabolism sensor histidine kinase WalK [Nocardioides sp.]|uniref:sensor histidine kinase n=1 Tax=Nocardioides sp. TaxID=35761 RepID=UPI00260FBEDD|nr:PAS domain-containing sensor histidine kinase [Nocardioides sp.]